MGRLILYTTRGCPYSIQLKQLFDSKRFPYLEINLSDFPERRAELEILSSGDKTVPRVFFNRKHMGGNAEIMELENKSELDTLLNTLANEDTPSDIPSDPNDASSATRSQSYVEFDEEIDEIYQKLRDSKTKLKVRDHGKFLFGSTKKCFKASDLVAWLMTYLKLEEKQAIEVGQKLLDFKYMFKTKEKETTQWPLFENTNDIYKFYADVDPQVLNMKRAWTGTSKTAVEVANQLRKQIILIADNYIYNQGKAVDYEAVSKSQEYQYYLTCTLEMQTVDVGTLSPNELKAFFLNVYNSLVIHANIVVGPPNRHTFFSSYYYLIGGHKYSLNDIEHGILRGNRNPPNSRNMPFPKHDPRLDFIVNPFDPRIHFALVCGARSCPAIRVFYPQNINESLQYAAQVYCTEEVAIKDKKVTLPKLFSWYREDFGSNEVQMLKWIGDYLSPEKRAELIGALTNPSVTYSEYDWKTNSKRYDEAAEAPPSPKLSPNVETPSVEDTSQVIVPCPGYKIIAPSKHDRKNSYLKTSTVEALNYSAYYKESFEVHKNYIGDTEIGPICISTKKMGNTKGKKYEVLIRDKEGDFYMMLGATDGKQLWETLKNMRPELNKKNFHRVANDNIVKDLIEFEEKQLLKEFKVGVLYYKDGQRTDDEMYSNQHGTKFPRNFSHPDESSVHYKRFLEILGDLIVLQGWTRFSAELDTGSNYTGTHSVFTTWNSQDIMYHVATLLPYKETDRQQLERKRHLGNDIVTIIFHDGHTPFNPSCIKSEYNQVFIVVRVEQENEWKVSICVKDTMEQFNLEWPNATDVFRVPKLLREFLIASSLSAIRCCLKASTSTFNKKVRGFRTIALKQIMTNYIVCE